MEDTTVVFKAGSYYLITSEEITVDSFQLHQQAELALAARGKSGWSFWKLPVTFIPAIFLPHLAGCDWAMVAAVHYKKNMRPVCTPSAKNFASGRTGGGRYSLHAGIRPVPQEDWAILRIQSLLAMQRYQEAKEVYEETANRMLDEFGVKPSERLNECMRQLETVLPSSKASLEQLQEVLKEEDVSRGAYYCPFPSFVSIHTAL